MTAPVSRLPDADRAVSSVSDLLEPGEQVDVYLERTASRRLTVIPSGPRRLQAQDGTFSGYLRRERDGRETYGPVGDASPAGLARVISVGRRAGHLGRPVPMRRTTRYPAADGRWHNTGQRFDLRAFGADPGPALDAVGTELHPDQRVAALYATELLRESVFAHSHGQPRGSVAYGVEVTVVGAGSATNTMVSRYAATFDRIDLRGLGRELRLAAARTDHGAEFDGTAIVLTPSSSARLVGGLAGALLTDGGPDTGPLAVALVDDARNVDGYAAQATDCEGTPTGRTDLVGVDGQPARLGTRASYPTPDGLTGHARWDPVWKQPRPYTANVYLDGAGSGDPLLVGQRCVVVDVRPLGVAQNQAGGRMTYRLHAVRAVDGEPVGGYAPFTISGDLAGFLTAVTSAGAPESFFPGEFSCGGGYVAIDTSQLDVRSVL